MKRQYVKLPVTPLLALALLTSLLTAWSQTSSLLSLETIQATTGGPVQFTFRDEGTGATNYLAEVSPSVGSQADWRQATNAVFTALGGGNYRVNIASPAQPQGFYRVVGLGGTNGPIVIEFSTLAFQVVEGENALPTLVLSQPFNGIVYYTVSGTAMSGDYMTLNGQVMVNGATATIPVSLTDNEIIGQLKYLTLRLEAGAGYQLGDGTSTTIMIEENDAEWQGGFTTEDATLGFVLRIQKSNGVHTASLKSDGAGFFPSNPTPTAMLFTPNAFSAVATGIPMPAETTLVNEPMILSLSLSAMNGLTNQSVSATEVAGVGILISVVPAKPHLNTTNSGVFRLFKPPVTPSTNEVKLVTAP